jgi:hypothetical protein
LIQQIKQFYLNPKIKKTNLQENYTKEQVEEYLKCSQDPVYFIEKYVKINSLDHGFIPFELRGYQDDLIHVFHKERRVILLSPRQSGKTISTAAFILWYVFFNPDKTVAILANKAPVAREILARIVAAFETIPFFLQPGAKVLNKGSIELGNSSRIIASATSSTAIRGFSVNLLYLDEFAFVENAEEFFKSTFPTISSGKETKIIISSTPNGLNLFYKLFTDAQAGKNEFYPFEIEWHQVPGRDDEWKRQQEEILGEHGFRQEYGNEFLGSSNTLIAGTKLRELTSPFPISKDKKYIQNYAPIVGRSYATMVDVAGGNLGDNSTITVIDITESPYKICYTWKCNETRPINLPSIIVPICKRYNNAYLVIEKNAMGRGVCEACWFDHEYENMASTTVAKNSQAISGGFGRSSDYGVDMTKSVKRIGCSVLKGLVEENILVGFTEDQIFELSNFVAKNGTFMASSGNKDDLTMNLVMFAWLTTQSYFKELVGSGGVGVSIDDDSDLTPFGVNLNGKEDDPEDTSWLF